MTGMTFVKVMGSKMKVTKDAFQQCTFPAETYRLTVGHWRLASFCQNSVFVSE